MTDDKGMSLNLSDDDLHTQSDARRVQMHRFLHLERIKE